MSHLCMDHLGVSGELPLVCEPCPYWAGSVEGYNAELISQTPLEYVYPWALIPPTG